jgi:hypothetical protein
MITTERGGQEVGLNKLGADGWELVAVEPELREASQIDPAAKGQVTYTVRHFRTYYLKRPK